MRLTPSSFSPIARLSIARCFLIFSGGSVYDQMMTFQQRQRADAVDSELEQLEFTEIQKRTGATALLGGLAFMHSRGVAHRDVKSLNLLCNKELTVFKLVCCARSRILCYF